MQMHLPSLRSLIAMSLLIGLVAGFCRFMPEAVRVAHSSSGFRAWRDAVVKVLPGRMPQHDRLVNAAGLFARLVGWRLFNGVVRLENGMCGLEMRKIAKEGELAGQLARTVIASGCPFLFALTPCKMDNGGKLIPCGLRTCAHEAGDDFLEELASNGITTFDLRRELTGTPNDVARNFFWGDYHWNPVAAWKAAAGVAVKIATRLGDSPLAIQDAFREDAWKTVTADGLWTGYLTERAGSFFAGKDAVVWKEPRYRTTIRRIEADGSRKQGSFSDVVVERRGRARSAAWGGVIGGHSRARVVYENEDAPSSRTVLVLKDSFGRPVASYLSVAFRRVVAIDPRRLPEGACIGDLIRVENPDIVLECINPQLIRSQADKVDARHRRYFCWD